ncbi:MAG: heat-inducible transcription repressor HrcA, partial [Candidatus Hydrogenedentes bacterium]|nr:heat-inducible transcription repressor HrcA [Candidatus Hydrogenedentota bacterium]
MSEKHDLTEREQLILQAVVHTYITTAEPVGSRTIVKRFNLDFSPATVRNVMSDLEEAGFLQQVHTSSGRVPTDRGYRYYVDYLMRVQELTLAERARIEKDLSVLINDADEVMRQTSVLLATISHQTGIVETPDESQTLVRHIQIIALGDSRVGVLIADNYGRIRTIPVTVAEPITPHGLDRLTRFLNDNLRGVALDNLANSLQIRIRGILDQDKQMAEQALTLFNGLPNLRRSTLYLEGTRQLFEQPEFRDFNRAREMFSLFEEQDRLVGLLHTRQASREARGASI